MSAPVAPDRACADPSPGSIFGAGLVAHPADDVAVACFALPIYQQGARSGLRRPDVLEEAS